MRNPVAVLGIPIDDLDLEQVLRRVEEFISSRRFHQVATVNVDFLVKAMADPELRWILQTADLTPPDGMPLVWLARAVGAKLPGRVTGADMVPRLVELSQERGYRIFILGGEERRVATAVQKLKDRYPKAQICGTYSPPFAPLEEMDNEEILRRVHEARPDILLVAFGNPKQEKWIWRHRHVLEVPCCIGVGGSLDFVAGAVRRAPAWMRRNGLEWFYRLCLQPRRLWRRYLWGLVAFGTLALRQWLASRSLGTISRRHRLDAATLEDHLIISVTGRCDYKDLPLFKELVNQAFDRGQNLVLDLNRACYLDDQVLGALVNLQKRAVWADCKVSLIGAGPQVRGLLRSACLSATFRIFENLAAALQAEGPNPLDEQLAPLAGSMELLRGSWAGDGE